MTTRGIRTYSSEHWQRHWASLYLPFQSLWGVFFFQAAHDLLRRWKKGGVGLVGKGVDWGGCGLLLFSSFTSQVNPHYPGPWSLVTAAFRAFAIEGLFISWLLVYQIILSGSDKIVKIISKSNFKLYQVSINNTIYPAISFIFSFNLYLFTPNRFQICHVPSLDDCHRKRWGSDLWSATGFNQPVTVGRKSDRAAGQNHKHRSGEFCLCHIQNIHCMGCHLG